MILLIVQFLIFASLVLSVYMIVVTLERCRSEKRYAFIYCIITIFLYTLGYFIEISCGNVDAGIIAIKIMYAGGCFMSPFFFFFVADYCEIRIPKKYYRIPLLVVPILFYLLVLSFDSHLLLYSSFNYDPFKPIMGMVIEPGPFYLVGTFYPLLCIILTCIVLIRSIISQSRGRRRGLVLLLVSSLAPLIANFAYVALSFFFKTAVAGINFTAFVMVISNFIFYYNVIRNDLFDLAPKAHAITMDLIRDAFVVLDRGMAYTGSNKKAQELFPALLLLHKGASILGLENWPEKLLEKQGALEKATSAANIPETKEVEFTLPHRPGRIFSGWINRVTSESGVTLGWVILIQDITETVSLIQSIRAQRDEIAAMRDNLKEGIFLMDREYRIQDSYSRALEDVLSGRNLKGRRFTDLLGSSFNQKDLSTIADYFGMILDKSVDAQMLEDMNPLVEFSYISSESGEQKTLRCHFTPLDHAGGEVFLMGTIQDISAETNLKKQLAEEETRRQDEMRNLFEVMQVDQRVFVNFNDDADYEFRKINEVLTDENKSWKQKLISVYQSVHAIKSNAVVVGLSGYGEKLHALETKIKALHGKDEAPDLHAVKNIAEELEKLAQYKEEFPEILRRLHNFSATGAGEIKKDDEVFVEALKQACERVASDEQKKVIFSVKTFDREALNRGPRREMKDILIQLVRNAVHHGIEKPEERLSLGKAETGEVKLSVKMENNNVHIVFGDDGRGLDFEKIAHKADTQGLLKNPAKDKTNRQLLSHLIFSPAFSTSETEDVHAGRGVGLNLVRDRLREVQGRIHIHNKEGQGLGFSIHIPAKG